MHLLYWHHKPDIYTPFYRIYPSPSVCITTVCNVMHVWNLLNCCMCEIVIFMYLCNFYWAAVTREFPQCEINKAYLILFKVDLFSLTHKFNFSSIEGDELLALQTFASYLQQKIYIIKHISMSPETVTETLETAAERKRGGNWILDNISHPLATELMQLQTILPHHPQSNAESSQLSRYVFSTNVTYSR